MSVLGAPPLPYHASLVGMVDHAMTDRIAKIIAAMRSSGVTRARIAVHSDGGYLADGIAIYNLLRGSGLTVHTHNIGNISSAAIYVFLAGSARKCVPTGRYLLHATTSQTGRPSSADDLTALAANVAFDDERTSRILNAHLRLEESQRQMMRTADLIIGPEEAVRIGLAHEVSEFSIPAGIRYAAI